MRKPLGSSGFFFVIAEGFEPSTACLEGRCSIQLSYATFLDFFVSGWQDSNLRPPGPKPGAITGLRYTPKADANIKLFLASAKLFQNMCFLEFGIPQIHKHYFTRIIFGSTAIAKSDVKPF